MCRIRLEKALWFLSVSLLGCACTDPTASDSTTTGLTSVVLQMDWYAEPEHGGFYLAALNGYYRDAGIDLEIRPTANAPSNYTLVAAGEIAMALGTSDNLIVAQSRGLPLVGLLPYFQHDPQGVMFHRLHGIEDLSQLHGRRVKISPGLHYVEYLQQALDIKMQLVPMDGSLVQFVQDPTLIQQCFLTSEPYHARAQGVEVGVLPFWDAGLDPYRLVYANRHFVEAHPDLVRAFVNASLAGWREFMLGDTDHVFAEIARRNPQHDADSMTWTVQQMHALALTQGHAHHNESIGTIDLARLQQQVAQLDALGLLDAPVEAEGIMALPVYPESLVRWPDTKQPTTTALQEESL